MTTATQDAPHQNPTPQSLSPLDQQRLRDARAQRVRKIRMVAEACQTPDRLALVSFGMMGVSIELTADQTQSLAATLIKHLLDEHASDLGAEPLPTDLEWVHEIADAASPKSPSMDPKNQGSPKADPKKSQKKK